MSKPNDYKGGRDSLLYYFDKGKVVFTEEFHIQRGSCCGNGCRHCPYEPQHKKGTTSIKK